jgi:predicted dehydrogenase
MTRLRVGVAGGGLIAQVVHLPLLTSLADRFDVVALSEPSAATAEAVAARHGIARTHADWRDLLERERLHAVIACSPSHTHADLVLAALDLGVHVFVEKPLCLDPADAVRIADRQRAGKVVVQVGYMKRFDPAFETLIERLPDRPDSLRLIDVVTYDPRLARDPFVPRSELTLGEHVPRDVLEAGRISEREQVAEAVGTDEPAAIRAYVDAYLGALVHDVNLVHGALDRLHLGTMVQPVAAHWQGAEAASISLSLKGGARWNSAWLLLEGMDEFRETVTLYLDDAVHTLCFGAPYQFDLATTYEIATGGNGQRRERFAAIRNVYRAELEHFHDCVVNSTPCRTPPEQAARDISVLRDAFAISLNRPTGTRPPLARLS